MAKHLTLLLIVLVMISISPSPPAQALTPLRSPEQLAHDATLMAEASQTISAEVRRCFHAPPTPGPERITMRFFLAQGGTRLSQLQVHQADPAPSPGLRRAAFSAVNRCAPYTVRGELQNWGGFWVTITLETPRRAR